MKKKRGIFGVLLFIFIFLQLNTVFAEEPKAGATAKQEATASAQASAAPASAPKNDAGDTAWILISTALVMLMTPGLALFYAGMVRRKNVLGTIMQSFIILALISIQWVLWGYSLAF